MKMNILFTLLIQKPIDFTRQDLVKDGSYEKVDAERLYLLEENKKTGNALYILDGKTTDFRNPEKRTYLLSSIDGTVRNCPISEEELKHLPKRNTLPCLANDFEKFGSVLPHDIPVSHSGTLEDFRQELSFGSSLLSIIDSISDDSCLPCDQISCFPHHFMNCAAIFNRFGQLVNVFVKLKKDTEDGPIVYFCNLNHVFSDSVSDEVKDTIRRSLKCSFSDFEPTDVSELSLKNGNRFFVQPMKIKDAKMSRAFQNADFVLANYGSTAFLSSMIYNGGSVLCIQNKTITYDNFVPFSNAYQDCNDEIMNPNPRTTRVKVLRFPR